LVNGQQIGFAIVTIVCNQLVRSILAELVMPGLFDVSKEILLVTSGSQGTLAPGYIDTETNRDHAAGVQRLALDDRQRGGWADFC
jgi:hypothetical protein